MRPQHDNFLIRKDLDQEFPPTPPVTTFAYFSLFLPQNVTVLSLYNPHSANPRKTERREREGGGEKGQWGGDGERGEGEGRGERERRENGMEMGREGRGGGEGREGGVEDLKMFLTKI